MHIHHVGVYRHAQRYIQLADHAFLGLTVSGLVHSRTSGGALSATDVPYLSILLAGESSDFEFNPTRENWVIQLDSPELRANPGDPASVQLRAASGWVSVPRVVRFGPARVPGWRDEFRSIREAMSSPLPIDRFRAELGVLGILRAFVDSGARTRTKTPAQELRQSIDEDAEGEYTLETLAQRVGYSGDHLRKLFEVEFGIGPQAYRAQRRLAVVMELIANSRLNVKEIAARAGFKHVSHLSASFKSAFGITPREGIRRYRHGR
jgi:AraC-like DNA-binding protein